MLIKGFSVALIFRWIDWLFAESEYAMGILVARSFPMAIVLGAHPQDVS